MIRSYNPLKTDHLICEETIVPRKIQKVQSPGKIETRKSQKTQPPTAPTDFYYDSQKWRVGFPRNFRQNRFYNYGHYFPRYGFNAYEQMPMRRRGYFGHHFEEIEKNVKEYDRSGNCSLDFVRNHRILTPFDRAKRMKAICEDCFKTDPAPGSLRILLKINIELYFILFFSFFIQILIFRVQTFYFSL